MKLLSVNIGTKQTVQIGSRKVYTGIFKESVDGDVAVGPLGLEGDAIVSTKHHGGPDQAVYLYSEEDYEWFRKNHKTFYHPGMFGENFTLDSYGIDPVRIGTQFRFGKVLLEATDPRIPCANFAAKIGDLEWVKKFRKARRPGVYCRVLQSGKVKAGTNFETIPGDDSFPTIVEAFEFYLKDTWDKEGMANLLRAPISLRSRTEFEHLMLER